VFTLEQIYCVKTNFQRLIIILLKNEEYARHLGYGEKQLLLTVVTFTIT